MTTRVDPRDLTAAEVPLTVEIHGPGLDVSARLESSARFGALLTELQGRLGRVAVDTTIGSAASTDLSDLFHRTIDLRARSGAPPCDDELDELARAVAQEQARRAEARS